MQASGRSRDAWKELIRQAARDALPEGCWLLTEALAVTIFIFPNAIMRGDVDNRVKPILDAMTQCVYSDDELVERVVVQKFEPKRIFPFQDPSELDFAHFWNFLLKSTAYGLASFGANPLKCLSVFSKCAKSS